MKTKTEQKRRQLLDTHKIFDGSLLEIPAEPDPVPPAVSKTQIHLTLDIRISSSNT